MRTRAQSIGTTMVKLTLTVHCFVAPIPDPGLRLRHLPCKPSTDRVIGHQPPPPPARLSVDCLAVILQANSVPVSQNAHRRARVRGGRCQTCNGWFSKLIGSRLAWSERAQQAREMAYARFPVGGKQRLARLSATIARARGGTRGLLAARPADRRAVQTMSTV